MKGVKLDKGNKNGRMDENISISILNEKPVPLAVPIADEKRMHLKGSKHNRDALRNNKLLPAIDSLFRCKDLNRAMDKATFCSSLVGDHERGADSENCKTNTLFGR